MIRLTALGAISLLAVSTGALADPQTATSLCTTADKAGKPFNAFKMVSQLKANGRRTVAISTAPVAKGAAASAKFVPLASSTKELPDFQKPGGDGDLHYAATDSRGPSKGDVYEFVLTITDSEGTLTEGKLVVSSKATKRKAQYKINCTNTFK